MKDIKIIKAFGDTEPFSEQKLIHSLKRSGVNDYIISSIVEELMGHLKDGMTTKEIYRMAFDLLKQYSPPHAARYRLKQAINNLGPSGFPFELYVAELLKIEGFVVQTGVIAEGHCIKHEIDVIAEKDKLYCLIECKFHNSQGIHCDVKIPLYIHSRFLDVIGKMKLLSDYENKHHQAWVFTNTRFTDDAITYGTCMDINLISWKYPQGKSLRDRINQSGLHPLTCLTTLTAHEKQQLLQQRIVLCRDIINQPSLLQVVGIKNPARAERVLQEAKHLITPE